LNKFPKSAENSMRKEQDFSFSIPSSHDRECEGSIPTISSEHAVAAVPGKVVFEKQDKPQDLCADEGNFAEFLIDDDGYQLYLLLTATKDFKSRHWATGDDTPQMGAAVGFEPSRLMRKNTGLPRAPPRLFCRSYWRLLTSRLARRNDTGLHTLEGGLVASS
jgi:hypothetical protein